MRYVPNTPHIAKTMLESMGKASIQELFSSIPESVQLKEPLKLAPGMSEMEELQHFQKLAQSNTGAKCLSFLGGGSYDHFIPLITDTLISRGEFLTSYTPYQPEVTQGTLQAIFEFQSFICSLTGMEVANASVYDGATALAEGVLMACRIQRNRNTILVPETLNPSYLSVLKTYISRLDIHLESISCQSSGQMHQEELDAHLNESVAAVVVQQPNFYGVVEPLSIIAQQAHDAGAFLITATSEAMSLAALESPGSAGADIVVGEAQSLGIPMSFGGPYLGIMATKDKYKRNLPGRIVGKTVDEEGRPGFVITLATREQHIRREKATSNICTNQNLIMLMSVMYLTAMGQKGLQTVAHQNIAKMSYFLDQLKQHTAYQTPFSGDVFNEVVLQCPTSAQSIVERASKKDIIPGVALGAYNANLENYLLVSITETKTRQQIDQLIQTLNEVAPA